MTNYSQDIMEMIPGETPKQKYDFMVALRQHLQDISYPRRWTQSDGWTMSEVAKETEKLQLKPLIF